jgi:hypothetical protein
MSFQKKTVKKGVSNLSIFFLKLCAMRRVSDDWFISFNKASRLFLISSYPSFKAVTASACADPRNLINVLLLQGGDLNVKPVFPNDVLTMKRNCRDFGQNKNKL